MKRLDYQIWKIYWKEKNQKVRYKGDEGVILKITKDTVFVELYRAEDNKVVYVKPVSENGNMGADFEIINQVNEASTKEYIEHLENIRNDFYNRGFKEKATSSNRPRPNEPLDIYPK